MTEHREFVRQIKKYSKSKIDNFRNIAEAIITDISYKDKKVKIKILPEEVECWARMSFDDISEKTINGNMPLKGSLCLVFIEPNSNGDIYDNVIVIKQLNNLTKYKTDRRLAIGNKDVNYYQVKPNAGGSINLFKDNDGAERVWINCTKHFDILASDGKVNIVCPDISLGQKDLGNAKLLVNSPHLDVYNSMVSLVKDFLNVLVTSPTMGDMGTLIPLSARNPAIIPNLTELLLKYSLPTSGGGIKDDLNKTSKTKAT